MRSEKERFQTTENPPQEVSRRPRTLQSLEVGANLAPRGVPKAIQNRSKSELGSLQDPRPPPGVPPGRRMTPQSKKKRLILTPKICKKRPASRFVFQRFWAMQCNAIRYTTIQCNAMQCNAMAQPNARKSAMSCSVPCMRYPRALAMPSSRGGRSEAQQN